MTNDDGGVRPTQPAPPSPFAYPAYQSQGYQHPYPPPGYGPPSYPPPGYGQTAYPGYSPPPALKPGIIPLRPLGLSEIFNAAFAYIRVNPKATLGLTAVVVIITQLIVLIFTTVVPLAAYGDTAMSRVQDDSTTGLLGTYLSEMVGVVASALSGVVLSGMLTVVIGRAVFAAPITIREAWDRIRGRLAALIGLTLLEGLGAVLLAAIGVGIITLSAVASPTLGVLLIFPILVGLAAVFVFFWTKLSFAPAVIVLERSRVFGAIGRSFALVRGSFWRVFGILILGAIVAQMVAYAVSIPFAVGALVLGLTSSSTGLSLGAMAILSVGGAIGQIITAPFTAGIVVLLYTDRRMRAEAFDLVLQTGARVETVESADSTDHLWLTRQP
ncbi:MAG TPA: hypothetical protein VH496_06535 [Mycobacterium sp.]